MGADLYLRKKFAEKGENRVGGADNGYFRDSYNMWNLLWKFKLDYWVWFKSFLNDKSELTPEKAKEVLEGLKVAESTFEDTLFFMKDEHSKYFREHYKELQDLLNACIETGEVIDCSI